MNSLAGFLIYIAAYRLLILTTSINENVLIEQTLDIIRDPDC